MYTKAISECTKDDVNIFGGKGAMLGELSHVYDKLSTPILIPGGVNISAEAFKDWITEAGLTDANLANALKTVGMDVVKLKALTDTAKAKLSQVNVNADLVKEVLESLDKNQLYAVRSSGIGEDGAETAFAGAHDSILKVKPNEKDVAEAIRNVWLSTFDTRALFYRVKNGKFDLPLRQGVVVQEMVEPKFAGVSFSVDTRTGSRKHGYVEYVSGLANEMVEGSKTPESYSFIKAEIEKSNDHLYFVAQTTKELEEIFGYPVDIEWCWDGKTLNIVQLRPLTALPSELTEEQVTIMEVTHPEYGVPSMIGQTFSRGQIKAKGFISREQAKKTLATPEGKTPQWKIEERVLLVPYTTPKDMAILEKVGGVIVTMGGATSHAAITCREFGKPCAKFTKEQVASFNFNPSAGIFDFKKQPFFMDANGAGGKTAFYDIKDKK